MTNLIDLVPGVEAEDFAYLAQLEIEEVKVEEVEYLNPEANLDDLLSEANEEARIRKLGNSKRPSDPTKIAEWNEVVAQRAWQQEALVALLCEEHCECGHSAERLIGWYRYDTHRTDPTAFRWVCVEQPDGTLSTFHHRVRKSVIWCKHCIDKYPSATDFDLPVDALGEPCEVADEIIQLELPINELD